MYGVFIWDIYTCPLGGYCAFFCLLFAYTCICVGYLIPVEEQRWVFVF